MSKLEDIQKKRYFFHDLKDSELKEDWKWLIEQAKRVQELEQKNDRLKQEADFWRVEDREMMRLSHENKRLKQALEFYANEKNYERAYDDEVLFDYLPSEIDFDNGEKARKALEGEG